MPINSGMLSSLKHDYETPPELFDTLDDIFHFVIDAAASDNNAKTGTYFTEEDDGLVQDWTDTTWVNPPYGREIPKWVKKAYHESVLHKIVVVMLLPARTDTAWFHDFIMPHAYEICFIRGRIRFVGTSNSAPFPSMIVVFCGLFEREEGPKLFACDKNGNLLE